MDIRKEPTGRFAALIHARRKCRRETFVVRPTLEKKESHANVFFFLRGGG